MKYNRLNAHRSASGTVAQVPVRAQSWRRNNNAGWWRPFDRKEVSRLKRTAKEYERRTKQKGKINGALGQTGIQVLEALLEVIEFKTGRLEPSIAYIANRIKRCSKTVVEALKRLRAHGFLDWRRRYEETDAGNAFGVPQKRQISNAYRILIPEGLIKKIGILFCPTPLPVDFEEHKNEWKERQKKMLEGLNSLDKAKAIGIQGGLLEAIEKIQNLIERD